jgi:flavin reductase (DIM6/NTAB) family NADH-FMN oxidoreductase RutF
LRRARYRSNSYSTRREVLLLQGKLNERNLRAALGQFATGVTIITAVGPRGELLGNTVNSFNSVSLEPPLILWCMGRHRMSLKGYLATDHFVVNVLSEGQRDLSIRFARTGTDKWDGVAREVGKTGCPILVGAVAVLECRTRHTYVGGDHVIFVGEVLQSFVDPSKTPLLFFKGQYRHLSPELTAIS